MLVRMKFSSCGRHVDVTPRGAKCCRDVAVVTRPRTFPSQSSLQAGRVPYLRCSVRCPCDVNESLAREAVRLPHHRETCPYSCRSLTLRSLLPQASPDALCPAASQRSLATRRTQFRRRRRACCRVNRWTISANAVGIQTCPLSVCVFFRRMGQVRNDAAGSPDAIVESA
jgi:hypothetical protein